MKEEQIKQWESTKADYINRQMAAFQKYFGKDATTCSDCGGPAWHMCEKNLRDMVSMTADAVMRSFMENKHE